ncbi:hypothetical protein F5B21DRAFT_497729 [Xylaria acuta]|nr:hypothetical protein F5B21DRAFT_497729 [Xylaria acuta]
MLALWHLLIGNFRSWRRRLLHLSTSTVRRFCATWRKLGCRLMRRTILWSSHGRPGGMMSSVLVLNRSFGQSCWLVTKGDTTQPRTRASISERRRQNPKPPRVTNESSFDKTQRHSTAQSGEDVRPFFWCFRGPLFGHSFIARLLDMYSAL